MGEVPGNSGAGLAGQCPENAACFAFYQSRNAGDDYDDDDDDDGRLFVCGVLLNSDRNATAMDF